MQYNVNLAKLAIRTESIVPDLNGQEAQLVAALELAIIAGKILDQVKRKIFYGERGEYNPSILNQAAEQLANLEAFNYTAGEFVELAGVPPVTSPNTRAVHGIIGVMTEGAELGEALLQYIKTGEFDAVNLIEEVADVEWYTAVLQDTLNFPLDGMYQFLIAKLAARYGEKFSDESAVIRDIGNERDVMERFLKAHNESL